MGRIRVTIVVGTRPEAIKMVPVYLSVLNDPDMQVRLIVTAQHRQMLDQVLAEYCITPDVDLDLMRPDQTLGELSARIITGVQRALAEMAPDVVLVHGDTTTCLFAAMAAFYEGIPVGHVEAGLRTYDLIRPWPEEMNRRLVDPISRWCFAPTVGAANNLRAERIPVNNIFITGNTIVDALRLARERVRRRRPAVCEELERLVNGRRLILVTGHRRESFGKPLLEFCRALRDTVYRHPDTTLIYAVHLNPNVTGPVNTVLGGQSRIHLIPPLDHLAFVYLLDRCYMIITDSGGIQEEAPSFGKPVLVAREVTERPEAVEAGLARLVGTSRKRIVEEASRLLSDGQAYSAMSSGKNPYGDGRASERIRQVLRVSLADGKRQGIHRC